MKNKKIRHKNKAKKVIKNDPKLGKVYRSNNISSNIRPIEDQTDPYDTRTSRIDDDDDNGLVSGIATILAAEAIENVVENIVDNNDTTTDDNTDFGGFGDGDSDGAGAGD